MEEVIIPLAAFAMAFGIAYFGMTTKHKERMKLIENGADPELFKSKPNKGIAIKWGFLLIGIGLGLVLGYLIGETTIINTEVAIPSMILLFGGTFLLIGNKQASKLDKDSNQ